MKLSELSEEFVIAAAVSLVFVVLALAAGTALVIGVYKDPPTSQVEVRTGGEK